MFFMVKKARFAASFSKEGHNVAVSEGHLTCKLNECSCWEGSGGNGTVCINAVAPNSRASIKKKTFSLHFSAVTCTNTDHRNVKPSDKLKFQEVLSSAC